MGPSCIGLCPECLNKLESGEFGGQPILLVTWTSHYAVANTDAYVCLLIQFFLMGVIICQLKRVEIPLHTQVCV